MKYKIFKNIEEAQKVSAGRATAMGCQSLEEDGTAHWWTVIVHPIDGRAAIAVPEEDEQFFLDLKEESELIADNWLKDPVVAPSPFGVQFDEDKE
jgi:hypothetical protein